MMTFTIACGQVAAFIFSFVLIGLGIASPQLSMFALLIGLGAILLICTCASAVHMLARPVAFGSLYNFARGWTAATLVLSGLLYATEWLERAWSFKGF